jgi:hypothetical protein
VSPFGIPSVANSSVAEPEAAAVAKESPDSTPSRGALQSPLTAAGEILRVTRAKGPCLRERESLSRNVLSPRPRRSICTGALTEPASSSSPQPPKNWPGLGGPTLMRIACGNGTMQDFRWKTAHCPVP